MNPYELRRLLKNTRELSALLSKGAPGLSLKVSALASEIEAYVANPRRVQP